MAPGAKSPQYVVLKMDDLATRWWGEWKTLADLVKAEHVRIGFGIFCSSVTEGNAAYDAWIGELCTDDRFELWLHGEVRIRISMSRLSCPDR